MTTLSEQTNNLYALYEQSIVNLAQAMVVKFDVVAKATNNIVLNKSGQLVDPDDRTEWKYYQNISGTYNFTDTPMSVYSLDSETTIDFSVSALASNPVTAAAYQYGSALYNELLATYPDQELLILGILYPCDINTAINAPDGTILSYPKFLVESQEIDLIDNIQQWLYAYVKRWVINPFALTDELYPAMAQLQVNMNLIGIIGNERLRACKTNQAHSFHIRQYLRSHGFVDVYLNELSSEQALRLYRNIAYFVRNAGFTSTFDDLVEILFTKSGMPVYKYNSYQKTEALSRATVDDTSYMLPTVIFKREPVNSIAKNYPAPNFDLTQIFEILADTAPGTNTYQTFHGTEIENTFDRSDSSSYPTKVVEVGVNPVASPVQTITDNILFNQWVSTVCTNRYPVPVEYTPVGLVDPVRMTHQQALAMWIYATVMSMKPENPPADYVPLTRVPPIRAQRVAKTVIPTLNALLAGVDQTVTAQSLVSAIRDSAVATPSTIASLVEFTTFCTSLQNANSFQYIKYSIQEDPLVRAQLEGVVEYLYEDVEYTLNDLKDPTDSAKGMLYTDLMQQIGINLSGYSFEDFYTMAIEIYNYATGASSSTLLEPANIQTAMVSLMEYLSSYSIAFVKTGEIDTVVSVGHPVVRHYNLEMKEDENVNVDEVYCTVLSVDEQEDFSIEGDTSMTMVERSLDFENSLVLEDSPIDFSAGSAYQSATHQTEVDIPIGVWTTTTNMDPQDLFAQLTTAQKLSVLNQYQ